MIEIFSRRNASNCLPVMWTIGELALTHVRYDVGGSFGGNDTPEYLAMNPNGRIPTLRDGDFVLWESNAIVRYLCRRYDGKHALLPRSEELYALADQWMDWHKTTLYPSFIELFWAIVRTEPPLRCARQIHDLQNTTEAALLILDQQLTMRPFLLGKTISMADIPIGALVYRYRNLPIRRQDYPHIDAWYRRLTERAAFRKHVMFPFGDKPSEWYRLERGETAQT